MNAKTKAFFNGIKGKKIALCGMGRSHLPLIPLFTKYGAQVIACDKRSREQLGAAADEAEKNGAVLHKFRHTRSLAVLDDRRVDPVIKMRVAHDQK